MQHFFSPRTAYGCKYFEVDTTGEIREEEGARSGLQVIQPKSKIAQMKEQEAKQEEEMTKFL